MEKETNIEVPYVSSVQEIEALLEKFKASKFPNMTETEFLEYATKMAYFFEHAKEMKLTPDNNPDLVKESDHKKKVTVSINNNNYIDCYKGDFVPIFKVKEKNEAKSTENEIQVYLDAKQGAVWARVNTEKIIKPLGSKHQIRSECLCVSNYVIPKSSDVARIKYEQLNNKESWKPLNDSKAFKTYDDYKLEVAKGVLQVSRMDIDTMHLNDFDTLKKYPPEQRRLFKDYFSLVANPPHFHFICRDYVLLSRSRDAIALAINSEDLTKYLLDVGFTNSANEDIMKYDLGMPFVDMKKRKLKLKATSLQDICKNGITSVFQTLSKVEQQLLVEKIRQDIELKVRNIDKAKNKDAYSKLLKNVDKLSEILLGEGDVSHCDDFDLMTVFAYQTSALSQMYELSKNNLKLKSNIAKMGNEFYDLIEYSMSKSFYKNEYKDYYTENYKEQ